MSDDKTLVVVENCVIETGEDVEYPEGLVMLNSGHVKVIKTGCTSPEAAKLAEQLPTIKDRVEAAMALNEDPTVSCVEAVAGHNEDGDIVLYLAVRGLKTRRPKAPETEELGHE